MSVDESNIENMVETIAEKLEECATLLLACELEKKECKKCKDKKDCIIFIRTVLASLCRIEIAKLQTDDTEIPEGLYI